MTTRQKLKKVREQVLQVFRRLRVKREGKALRQEPVWCVKQREGQRGSRGEQEAGGRPQGLVGHDDLVGRRGGLHHALPKQSAFT